jgi:hypothetical protein
MKKIVLVVFALASITAASAQKKKDWTKVTGRAGDHLMLQLTSDHWIGTPDSIKSHMKGIARGLNAYVMLDKVFKGAPQFSVAFGVGVSTSNIYFKKYNIDIKGTSTNLAFQNLDSLDHFKKYKISMAYLEIPIELRYSFDPEHDMKSIKAAIGFKVGTLLNVHTKGKNLQDKSDKVINSFIQKETSKRYFNSTRIAATARIGYGNFSLFGSYQINNMFKDGVAPDTRLLQVGLTLSGL